jgi:uncharacterized phage infection (PIP) family protein YhgE
MAGRLAAWAGIAVSLLLIPATLLGYTNASSQVAGTADAVDERLAAALPLVEAASHAAGVAATAAAPIADTADAAASGAGSLATAFNEVAGFSDAYQSLRDSYQAAADAATAAAERLQSIAAMLPEGVAADLGSAIGRMEARAQQLEAQVAALRDAPMVGVVEDVASTIADLARHVEAGLVAIRTLLDDTAAKLQGTRDAVSVRSKEITLVLTVLAVAISAWLVYSAALNIALLRVLPRRGPRSA